MRRWNPDEKLKVEIPSPLGDGGPDLRVLQGRHQRGPDSALSADEALTKGKESDGPGKVQGGDAVPGSRIRGRPQLGDGREALLLSADSYFLAGGTANFVKAEAKYRDFLNRFPTSDRSDYVQMQIATAWRSRCSNPIGIRPRPSRH